MKNYKYILTHSSGNLTVEYNPIKWDKFNMVFRRSKTYHSVLRKQIEDSEFPLDGKAYIDTIYAAYGIDTEIGCEIQYLVKSSMTYSTLFIGIIDLSEWTSLRDTTSVKIIDSSVMAMFAARDEIKVPINRGTDLNGDAVASYTYLDTMTVEGVDIFEQIYMTFVSAQVAAPTNTEDTVETLTIEEEDWEDGNRRYENSSGVSVDTDYTAEATLTWNLTFPAGGGTVNLYAYISENGVPQIIAHQLISRGSAGVESGSVTESRSVSFAVPNSGYLGEMYCTITSIPGTITGYGVITTGTLQIYVITPGTSNSTIPMPLMHEVGAKLLEIITGVTDPLNAPLLGRTNSDPRTYGSDGAYSLIGIASGDILREYSFTDKPLTTSFFDYFKSIDALFNLGCWYDGTEFSIAAKEDFYKVSKIITLGEVQELEISVATDEYFNSVLCGFQDQLSYEETNGTQNFNVACEFANDGKRIQNLKDIQSVYHGDDYGIELSRKKGSYMHWSEDTKYDEQIFFIVGKRDSGFYKTIQGDEFNAVTGIYTPDTRLNLDITPMRNLLRHGDQLAVPLFLSSGDTVYLKKQFEIDLTTQKGGADPVITEKDDLAYSDLEEPLYYPDIYNFKSELTIAHIQQLQSDPHGYVEFDYIGVTYSGYIVEVSTKPFNRQGNWTLLKRNPNRT